jgi:hypothetical protein
MMRVEKATAKGLFSWSTDWSTHRFMLEVVANMMVAPRQMDVRKSQAGLATTHTNARTLPIRFNKQDCAAAASMSGL